MSFLDRKEVKDVLAYLRLIVNPRDDASVRRAIGWPARGAGRTTLEAVNAHAMANGLSFYDALGVTPGVSPKAQAAITSFRGLIEDLRRDLDSIPVEASALSSWGRRALEKIGAKAAIQADSDDPVQAERKWENAEELVNALGQLNPEDLAVPDRTGVGLLSDYLTRMTLDALDEEKDGDEDSEPKDEVTLLTLHGAKGLEYPVVFLVGMEEGLLPHKRTLEEATDLSEERRLCYVGITRARDQLILTRAKNRIRYGKAVLREPSRFLTEIPEDLVLTRDESTSGPDTSSKVVKEAHEVKVKDFLSQIRANIGKRP